MKRETRINREKKTVEAMIDLYCSKNHGLGLEKCSTCQEILAYAFKRIDRCQFSEDKPVCAQCKVHCYHPAMREKIKQVMRFSGPKMLWHHPILLILHIMDSRKDRKKQMD